MSGNGPVLLDFSKVDYINSSGIALIIQILMEADKTGRKIAVFGLTPHFQKVFTMVGIGKYAGLHKDEATASSIAVTGSSEAKFPENWRCACQILEFCDKN